ncbi:MAG: winged helix-turn-helix transcriptional regulator [Dehalococcoidia bacterium]
MARYGQFCPVAKSLEILGDQWTLLIVRDMLGGISHFNDLERGLPGISRGLLSQRLQLLRRAGIIEKRLHAGHRQSTEYTLTQSGQELAGVIGALTVWGEAWAFAEPEPEELDPVLLMWWLRGDVQPEKLSQTRAVVRFDFLMDRKAVFWLVITPADVTLCLTDPGYEVDLLVTSDLAALYKLWWGQITYEQAIRDYGVMIEGSPQLVREFPGWIRWSASRHMSELKSMRGASPVLRNGAIRED